MNIVVIVVDIEEVEDAGGDDKKHGRRRRGDKECDETTQLGPMTKHYFPTNILCHSISRYLASVPFCSPESPP